MKIPLDLKKINRTWLMLIAAIVLSLLTAWLAMTYLKSKEQSLLEQAAQRNAPGATVAAVVPVRPLPAGTILEENMVASRPVPVDFTDADTITVDQFNSIKGQVLLRPVTRGKPLRRSDVQEIFTDFAGTLKEGMRAITVNVDEINSISHMVVPGNLIDLMLILSGPEGSGSNNQTVIPFLEKVKVLATGQRITHNTPSEGGRIEERRTSYSNLTLEVTPADGARLALATDLGKLRAVLRNNKDATADDYENVNAQNFLDDIRARQKRTTPKGRSASSDTIEYIIGGRGNTSVSNVSPLGAAAGLPPPIPGGMPSVPPLAMPSSPADSLSNSGGGGGSAGAGTSASGSTSSSNDSSGSGKNVTMSRDSLNQLLQLNSAMTNAVVNSNKAAK